MGRRALEDRPAATASGTLEKRPAMHLLVYARDRALTGSLELDNPRTGEFATVVLMRGRVAKVRVDHAHALLATVIYELGFTERAAIDATLLELARGGQRHGELLLTRGALTRDRLTTALEEQAIRKLAILHAMPGEASFAFYDGFDALPTWPADGPRVDPLPAVWRGIREADRTPHLEEALARLGDVAWRIAPSAPIAFFALEQATAELVDVLQNPTRLEDLRFRARGSWKLAERLLYLLALTRSIEAVDATPVPSPVAAPTARPTATPTATPTRSIGVQLPSMSFSVSTPRVPSSVPPPSTRSSTPVPRDSEPAIPSRAEIALKAQRSAQESYYDLLGVPTGATVDQIRVAFARMSRTWRPERLPASLEDVRDLCAAVRTRLEEAHRTLTDPVTRAAYDERPPASIRPGAVKRSGGSVGDAETLFREAEIALGRKERGEAMELCKKAHALAPSEGRYEALIIWLEALSAPDEGKANLASYVERLGKLLDGDPACASALFYRATYLKRLGRDDAAARDFQMVVHLNPKNLEAVRELRLHNMRRRRA